MAKKMDTKTEDNCGITRRKSSQYVKLCPKDERNASLKKVSLILQKAENVRTLEEQQFLSEYSEIVVDLKQRWHRRDEAKRRLEEVEEPLEIIEAKCKVLVKAIAESEHLVIYTGAGISTAACIPDYRGTNGIWTRLQQGKDIGNHDLSLAEPTYTHMALSQLYHKKILKYVVSQNCDGLHLRSGLPRSALSELHGNMYIEVCKHCKPVREYWRLFDVTENTARYSHKTMRRCYVCSKELTDTIVHFGERGTLQWPLNWSGACKNADKADTIICLGSSLKVLKKYPWLWQMNKPAKKRPNLYIVNLQWTPKDDCAIMKINGKCDVIMRQIMKLLDVETPAYHREKDPIFTHATLLNDNENHTTNQPNLKINGSEEENSTAAEIKTEIIKTDEYKIEKNEIFEEMPNRQFCMNQVNVEQNGEQNEAFDLSITKRNNTRVNLNKSVKSETNTSIFSIDNILNKKTEIIPTNPNQTLQTTLMAYYLHLQNPLLNYYMPNLSNFYPYQTSLLYSGLHSIINPIPFLNYDFNVHNPIVKQEPTCAFCHKTYESLTCLFYGQIDSVFQKKLYRFSKKEQLNKELVCLCCDYTTEEESDSDSENKDTSKAKRMKIEEISDTKQIPITEHHHIETENDEISEDNLKKSDKIETKNKIQPGWFGKGYKKNRKFRKKQ